MFLPFFFCFILYRLKIYYSEALANAGAFFALYFIYVYINIKIYKIINKKVFTKINK